MSVSVHFFVGTGQHFQPLLVDNSRCMLLDPVQMLGDDQPRLMRCRADLLDLGSRPVTGQDHGEQA